MTDEQAKQIIEGQNIIIDGMDKLLALFTLEPVNEATNPILTTLEAANLLGVSRTLLLRACAKNEVPYRKIGSRYFFSKSGNNSMAA